MYNLYGKYIHFNEYTKTWNVFDREEQGLYLNEPSKMKSLESFDSIEKLLEAYKKETND